MKLYALKAVWNPYYNDPDRGFVSLGVQTDLVALADNAAVLRNRAKNLNKGFKNDVWSESRELELRMLYPRYTDFQDAHFVVEDVSDIYVGTAHE
jgi:hypothetical protein